MGFVHVFGNKVELNLGGRQHQYMRAFERFVLELTGAGASLAFVCDGQLLADKNDEWCRRRNDDHLSTIDALTSTTADGEKVNVQAFLKRRFGCKTIVKSLLKLIDDNRYGQVVISTRCDCDLAIANYAKKFPTLAVIASDSDFLIFDGDFQWWHSDSMDMNRMVVSRFERTKLMNLLNLTREQMKYLAAIAGNDFTKSLVRRSHNFKEIAEFCETLHEPRERILNDIVRFMQIDQRMDTEKAIDCVASSIKSYDIDPTDSTSIEMDKMSEYCLTNVMMYAFWHQEIFQYEMNFVDFKACSQSKGKNNNNDAHSFVDILLEVFRKLAGIMLKNTDHRNATLKIVTKYSADDGYAMKLHTPIYPRGKRNRLMHSTDAKIHAWNLQFEGKLNNIQNFHYFSKVLLTLIVYCLKNQTISTKPSGICCCGASDLHRTLDLIYRKCQKRLYQPFWHSHFCYR